ncbi:MAG: HEAT repeat domain-containing protein [Deltaproteobacteria bacterium]|nr:HEAT repeat domain-containing protein [Deltaproteobacteria bacterium]
MRRLPLLLMLLSLLGARPAFGGSRLAVERARQLEILERSTAVAIDLMLSGLRDESSQVRLAAVRALERLRPAGAVRYLILAAKTDFDQTVRETAAAAVRRLAPHRYVNTISATMPAHGNAKRVDLPRSVERHEARPRFPQFFVAGGGGVNLRRASESGAALVAVGLRWRYADAQLSLLFPALTWVFQARFDPLWRSRWVRPYLSVGVSLVTGDGTDDAPSAALFAGAGLRVRVWRFVWCYAEVLPSWTIVRSLPAAPRGSAVAAERLALPLLAGVRLDVWP